MDDVVLTLCKHDQALYSQTRINKSIGKILKSQKKTQSFLAIAFVYLVYENWQMQKRIKELESKER